MRRRVLTAWLAAGVLLPILVAPVAAVDPIPGRPIPDEPPVVQLTDLATASTVIDLDGDGTREVVAITALNELRGFAAVQGWWVDDEGEVTPSNQVRLRRSATFDDRVAIGNGIRIDEDAMTGVRLGEPSHLLTIQREGRDVVLATGMGDNPELTQPCCLTLWEVTSEGRGEIGLDLVGELNAVAAQLAAADLDGDGTDELLLTVPNSFQSNSGVTLVTLAWDGSGYRLTESGVFDGLPGFPLIADTGESDGVAGDDVLLVIAEIDTVGGFVRVTQRDGRLVLEEAAVGLPNGFARARIAELAGTPSIVSGDGQSINLYEWRRDAPIEPILATPNRDGVPMAVVGSGAETMVVVGVPPDLTAVQVFNEVTQAWGSVVGSDSRAGVFAAAARSSPSTPSWTHLGVVPGGLPGRPNAFVFGGMTVRFGDGMGEPMALLPGRWLAGTAGPDGAWIALASTQPPEIAANPSVLSTMPLREAGSLELAATASVLEPETGDGVLEPTLHGVAPDPQNPGDYIVGHEPFDLAFDAPPGSRVWWAAPSGAQEMTTVGPDGTVRLRLIEPGVGDVTDGTARQRSLWLVTPSGHAYHASWRVRIFRQPPSLGIGDEVPFLDFAPVVAGRTLPGSTMTVNGVPADVAPDGTFAVPVNPGIVPTEFRVVVTDPVGNQSERVISLVWPLDYRQLPWVPIAVFVLLTVAGLLYVWEPDARQRRRTAEDEESSFEEIGG